MARVGDLQAFEAALGWRFEDRGRLARALTHASAQGARSNERLEFLGDRVLGLIMAEALIKRHPDEAEGALAPRYNDLVRKETCALVAESLALGENLKMARSEAHTGGRRKAALLADAMEAIIAAIYLEGGYDAARKVVLGLWEPYLSAQDNAPRDAKTALQEWAQGRRLPLPDYHDIGRSGPDHAPRFTVEVRLANGATASGMAGSKRAAQQVAAQALLDQLEDRA